LSSKGSKQKSSGSEKKRKIEQEKKQETTIGVAIVLIAVVVLAAAAWVYFAPALSGGSTQTTAGEDPTLTTCINEGSLAEHIHVHLKIVINGEQVKIPANVGVTSSCTLPVHTHDDTGEIHIESPFVYPFNLKDFFLVWGQPFNNTQIMQYKVDSTHLLKMTVNGQQNTEFENYVFHDGDEIVITYGPP